MASVLLSSIVMISLHQSQSQSNEAMGTFHTEMSEIIERAVLRRNLLNSNQSNALDAQEIQDMLDAHNHYRRKTAKGFAPSLNGGTHPTAANMNYLFWDRALEKVATDYASRCYIEYNNNDTFEMIAAEHLASFTYPSNAATHGVSLGENFWYSGTNPPVFSGDDGAVINSVNSSSFGWFAEASNWEYGEYRKSDNCNYNGGTTTCNNYAQLIWGITRYVGCGYSQCLNPTWDDHQGTVDRSWVRTFVVCNYYPVGRRINDYPYINGTVCTQCDADRANENGTATYCDDGLCSGGVSKGYNLWPSTTNIDSCDDGTGRNVCNTTDSMTVEPTVSPNTNDEGTTMEPSTVPPTAHPAVIDTGFGNSTDPTTNPNVSSTWYSTTIAIDSYGERQVDDLTDLYQASVIAFVSIITLVGFVALIDAKCFRINDYFKIGAIISMTMQTMDLISDCFFVQQVSIQNKIDSKLEYNVLIYASAIFIVLPAFAALFQLYFYANKHWLNNDHVRSWLSKYSTLLLILSVITGSSFAAVSLLNSFIFQLELFDMGLTDKQLKGFNTKRVYSIVMMENVPQLCLQSYYIWSSGDDTATAITVSSIIFSIISIIVSVLSMTMQKKINYTQRFVSVSMNITGECIEENASKCRTMNRGFKTRFAMLIGADRNTIEIVKPKYISNGFGFSVNIYVNDKIDYQQLFIQSNETGKLSKIFKDIWNLSDSPNVSEIRSTIIESKEERKNTEIMQQTQIRINSIETEIAK